MYRITQFILAMLFLLFIGCKKEGKPNTNQHKVPNGMIWVSGKTFLQGATDTDKYAMPREKPRITT